MKKAITLGFFDGVHTGHMKIIKRVVSGAKMKSLAVTFDKAPSIKGHHNGLLTPSREKTRLLRSLGIDEVKVVKLTDRLRKMPPEAFFDKILLRKYRAGKIVVGGDFRFGRGRSGNAGMLAALCRKAGVEFEAVPVIKSGGRKVSSSAIRELLLDGRIERANRLLGRNYSISGIVTSGRARGSKMGFPTANLKVERDKLLPQGVYAGNAIVRNRVYNALANIGTRPTFSKTDKIIPEVYVRKFSGDILGKKITFMFSKKLRNERKFASADELKKQMLKDTYNKYHPKERRHN